MGAINYCFEKNVFVTSDIGVYWIHVIDSHKRPDFRCVGFLSSDRGNKLANRTKSRIIGESRAIRISVDPWSRGCFEGTTDGFVTVVIISARDY